MGQLPPEQPAFAQGYLTVTKVIYYYGDSTLYIYNTEIEQASANTALCNVRSHVVA